MIFFKGHKFNYAPDLNEFQTQNKSNSNSSGSTLPNSVHDIRADSSFDVFLPRLIHERDTLWAIDCDEIQVHNNYLI